MDHKPGTETTMAGNTARHSEVSPMQAGDEYGDQPPQQTTLGVTCEHQYYKHVLMHFFSP